MRPSFAETWLEVAATMARRGTCPRLRAGAVVTDSKFQVISTGYNGAPAGVKHCVDVGCILEHGHCVRAIHAEQNAIFQALRSDRIKNGILFSTHRPCIACCRMIAQTGLDQVVYALDYDSDNMKSEAAIMLGDAGINLCQYPDKTFQSWIREQVEW